MNMRINPTGIKRKRHADKISNIYFGQNKNAQMNRPAKHNAPSKKRVIPIFPSQFIQSLPYFRLERRKLYILLGGTCKKLIEEEK